MGILERFSGKKSSGAKLETDNTDNSQISPDERTEVAVVDTSVDDYQVLVDAARQAGMEVIQLSRGGDGIDELAGALKGREGIDELHILSHGAAGEIMLGDDLLSSATLSDHSEALGIISGTLSEGGDLLLYGCQVGEGEAGADFIRKLAIATGSDVAASDDLTGAGNQGGDWDLEVSTGSVAVNHSFVSAAESFASVLALPNGTQYTTPSGGWSASGDGTYFTASDSDNQLTMSDGTYGDPGLYILSITGKGGSHWIEVDADGTNLGTFELDSLIISEYAASDDWTNASITGYVAGGGTVTQTLTLPADWTAGYTANLNGTAFDGQDLTGFHLNFTADSSTYYSNLTLQSFSLSRAAPPNAPPVFTASGPFSVSESALNGASVGDVNAQDGENNGTDVNVTYAIQSGNPNGDGDGNAAFAIDAASGAITVNDSDDLDYEIATSYSLTIRATDNLSATTDQSVTINIGDVAPAITSGQGFDVNESAGNSDVVGTPTLTGTSDINSLAWSIQSGNTGSAFAIDSSTGEITVNDTTQLDRTNNAASYTLSIRATDGTTNADQDVTVNVTDDVAPTVTDGNISLSGASGTGGVFKVGDTVTATWNDTAGGDNNTDTISSVTVDFSAFGGGSAVAASNSSDTWTATYTIVAGAIDGTNLNVSLTATDDDGNPTTTADSTNAAVDNVAPTVTDANISISGASGTGGAFKVGDTVTATWNDTAGGDNNSDTLSGVTVDFSAFGGGAAVAASNSAGTWTATYTLTEDGGGSIDGTNLNVAVTATDNAGNSTTTADTTNATVDNDSPLVTDGNINVTSTGGGTGGTYVAGDILTVEWDDTASGDNNGDTISGVTVDFSAFGGGAAVAAVNSSGTWTATYTLTSGGIDATNLNVAVTATDNAGNSTTTADTSNLSTDNQAPTVTDANISISGASGTGGAFKVGDTVTATWNDTAGGDNNSDIISGVTVDFSAFGGGAAVAASNSAGTWTATYTLTEDGGGSIDGTNLNVAVTATDNAGNSTTTADTTNATVDNDSPGTPTGTLAVDENSANGTAAGMVTGGGSDGVTYSLTDNAGGRFAIDGSGNVTVADGSLLDREANASHTIGVRATDDAGNTTDADLSITINNVNEAPVLANLDGDSVSHGLGANGVSLDANGDAAVSDVDSPDFDGGNVTAAIVANGQAGEDVLAVGNVGAISVSGSNVVHSDGGGTVIGTVSGGSSGNDLVVSLNANANPARVQDLVRSIQYANSDPNSVNTAARTVRITVTDGDGGTETSAHQDVTVNLVRAPLIDLDGDDSSGAGSGGYSGSFTEGGGAVAVADSDSAITDDGTFKSLSVTLTNRPDGTAESLASTFGSGNQTVNGEAVTIGAYDSGTGQLTVTVDDASADATTMQMLMASIRYDNGSDDPDTSDRSIAFSAVDNDDNVGADATATISVEPVNDRPTLTAAGSDPTYTEDDAAVTLFSASSIDPVESADNIGEVVLTVTNVNDGADERLSVDGQEVVLTDATSGTTSANGFGYSVAVAGATATVTLTKSATAADWQTLIDNLGYRNASDAPDTSNRTVTLTSVQDTGSTANGGEDTHAGLSVASTVTVASINDAPTIAGLPDSIQSVTVGQAASLADFTVADVDGDDLTVTLTASNGTIRQVTDSDPDADGIQLTGAVDTINAALADATFTAAGVGDAGIDISVTDGIVGTPVTATYLLEASNPPLPSPSPDPEPEPEPEPGNTFDGVSIDSQTRSDGTQILTVPIVEDDRQDDPDTPLSTHADIPVATDDQGRDLLTVSIPTGVGLNVEGRTMPLGGQSATDELIRRIETMTESGSPERQSLTQEGQAFLNGLPSEDSLVVKTVLPTVAGDNAPGAPIIVTGNQAEEGTRTALVIDVRDLPSGTVLQIDNVDFVTLIGSTHAVGGQGRNVAVGDDSSQFIVLGEDDDRLHGNGGDDTVGSLGGDDQTFGGGGADIVYGGADQDILSGGSGSDRLNGGFGFDVALQSGALADYIVNVDGPGVTLTHPPSGEVDTFIDVERIQFDTGESLAIAHSQREAVAHHLVTTWLGRDLTREEAVTVQNWGDASPQDLVDAFQRLLAPVELQDKSADELLAGLDDNPSLLSLDVDRDFVGGEGNDQGYLPMGLGLNADGGTGHDVLHLSGGREGVHLEAKDGSLELTRYQDGAMLSLTNAEMIAFDDGDTVVLAHDSTEAALGRLVHTFFGRSATSDEWQMGREALQNPGITDEQILNWFQNQTDFASLNDGEYVQTLYQNTLGRDASVEEVHNYQVQLEAGVLDRNGLAVDLAQSDEALATIGSVMEFDGWV